MSNLQKKVPVRNRESKKTIENENMVEVLWNTK